MQKRNVFTVGSLILTLALLVLMVALIGVQPSAAAPPAIPTPVSVAASGSDPVFVEFFDAEVMTADTTSTCTALGDYSKADLYYTIDVDASGAVTHTVTWQFGNQPEQLADGLAVASNIAADVAGTMQQYQLYGNYACLEVDFDADATGTVTMTANALAR